MPILESFTAIVNPKNRQNRADRHPTPRRPAYSLCSLASGGILVFAATQGYNLNRSGFRTKGHIMNDMIQTTPAVMPETIPVRGEPEVDPFREIRELAEAVRVDCQIATREYLDQVRVPGGGE